VAICGYVDIKSAGFPVAARGELVAICSRYSGYIVAICGNLYSYWSWLLCICWLFAACLLGSVVLALGVAFHFCGLCGRRLMRLLVCCALVSVLWYEGGRGCVSVFVGAGGGTPESRRRRKLYPSILCSAG